jgi:ribosomal protein S13
MEDILALYEQAPDSDYPLVCFDETSKQLVKETRVPIPAKKGSPNKYDFEYERNGVKNIFMFFAPHENFRHAEVTDRRTKVDWAMMMKKLVDELFPKAKKIRLVEDNLNTHNPASLYEIFKPVEARRIIDKIEFHYTPKHGSWLDMAEIELSTLNKQCIARRIGDEIKLKSEIKAWEDKRNESGRTIDWQFTNKNARIKLKRLYPSIKSC